MSIDHELLGELYAEASRGAGTDRHPIKASKAPVSIVAGPPGSGKTTYVERTMQPGDLVVDVDALFAAVSFLPWYDKPRSLLPFVLEARDAIISRLGGKDTGTAYAWIVTAQSNADELYALEKNLRARRLKIMRVSRDECIERIANDERRAEQVEEWVAIVDAWFAEWYATSGEDEW